MKLSNSHKATQCIERITNETVASKNKSGKMPPHFERDFKELSKYMIY